jgi:oxygen-dependent protoporphyrinogen oxidase
VERVTSSLSRFYGEQRAEPLMFQVYRHARGIPQYTLGHTKRVAAIRAAEKRHLGLFFAGNHLGGVGVKDSVATAEKAALNARSMLFALESTDPEIV